jgi:hypothetical protein
MYRIDTDSFNIITNTENEAFEILLKVASYTKESFSVYMGVEVEELATPPKWAINYLTDLIHANYVHLGYVIKDSGVSGLLVAYNNLTDDITAGVADMSLSGNQPIIINSGIVAKDGALNSSYIVHAESVLKTFISNSKAEQ